MQWLLVLGTVFQREQGHSTVLEVGPEGRTSHVLQREQGSSTVWEVGPEGRTSHDYESNSQRTRDVGAMAALLWLLSMLQEQAQVLTSADKCSTGLAGPVGGKSGDTFASQFSAMLWLLSVWQAQAQVLTSVDKCRTVLARPVGGEPGDTVASQFSAVTGLGCSVAASAKGPLRVPAPAAVGCASGNPRGGSSAIAVSLPSTGLQVVSEETGRCRGMRTMEVEPAGPGGAPEGVPPWLLLSCLCSRGSQCGTVCWRAGQRVAPAVALRGAATEDRMPGAG